MTPEALAGIFLGKIKKWNDPVLRQANRGLRLPDLEIIVVHRADGSGTSYAWTDYLSKTIPEWKAQVGAGVAPGVPEAMRAASSSGVGGSASASAARGVVSGSVIFMAPTVGFLAAGGVQVGWRERMSL